MHVLLSGASSFTGMHITTALTDAKINVAVTFRRTLSEYGGLKAERISLLSKARKLEASPIGSPSFSQCIRSFKPDIYIHHGFDTTGYNQPGFPLRSRIESALHNMDTVCLTLSREGCKGIVYSDSIFSGCGSIICDGTVPFSPYGKAKLEIGNRLERLCKKHQLQFWRVVIPNPIGVLDNPKLLKHVFNAWKRKQTPTLFSPHLIRDNLPVGVLAKHYLKVCEYILEGRSGISNPSGWVCSVQELVERAGREWTGRTGLAAPVRIEVKHDSQPILLHNTSTMLTETDDWSEDYFWNQLVEETLNK